MKRSNQIALVGSIVAAISLVASSANAQYSLQGQITFGNGMGRASYGQTSSYYRPYDSRPKQWSYTYPSDHRGINQCDMGRGAPWRSSGNRFGWQDWHPTPLPRDYGPNHPIRPYNADREAPYNSNGGGGMLGEPANGRNGGGGELGGPRSGGQRDGGQRGGQGGALGNLGSPRGTSGYDAGVIDFLD